MKSLSPRQSGEFIASKSQHVRVQTDQAKIAANILYERMTKEKYSPKAWREWPLHPKELTKETVDWIFVVDCLNFSFWLPGDKQFQLEFDGKIYEDYEALCAAINRALKEGIAITTPSFYRHVTYEKMCHIFRSANGTVLPLLEQRTRNLQEAGTILCANFDGSFANLLENCHGDVKIAIEKVTSELTSFQDEFVYDNTTVCIYKRVQILLADIWACFEGKSYGNFLNIDELTMFADYRVPQALLSLNLLKYSPELMEKVEKGVELDFGSREELEIRGCSIHAVELLREEMKILQQQQVENEENLAVINSIVIDFFLWDYATLNAEKVKSCPEHKTRSIYY